ncbi:uncharacterized protein LOC128166171 isoform X1 [Crassostrea angulata]|uniref:uncharacterized protein LOC128166171 isoform X1 n=1 Tax=Magallana angulata TaxID=2784310 RepID=UPI0022B11B81|nr:uncharacterized protein LOC128166171 isoform X1 [Crassostrea angulata]
MRMGTKGKTAWSLETYTIRDVVYKMGLPRTVRVTEGVYSQNEQESLSTGDVIRLEEVSELRRVMTRATLMDGDVTDLQIPLNHNAPVYVYTGSETVYKSVQELIHLFPGHVHVDSPIKVVTLDQGGGEGEEIDLSWGACLKLDKVASGQGLHCTCGNKRVCLRPFQRGKFSRIPKNDIMCFKDVIRNFSLPIKVRFMEKPPELSSVLDISQVNYFSLERVESEVAIVGHELKPDGSRVSDNQLTVAMTQANDVEVQICLKNETPPAVSQSSPRVTTRAEKKRPPPVPQRSSSIPSSFGKSVPLIKTRLMNQQVPVDHSNVASVNPQPASVGNRTGLLSSFGAKLPVLPPRKMSNPETMKEIHRGGIGLLSQENKLCAVPPLPARSRSPSEEATDITLHTTLGRNTPEIVKKLETGLTLNKLPPELGRQLFNNNSNSSGGGSNRNSKSNTPTKPLSNRSSVDDYQSLEDSDSSENADEAEYISMASTSKLLKRKPPTPIRGTQQTTQPTPSTAPDVPLRNRSNSSSQNHAGLIAGLAQNVVSRRVSPLQEQQQAPVPAITIETASVQGVPMNEGVVSVMQVPISSQNLDQYYTSIPKKFRQSLVLVHKEFFNRYGDSKPTGAVCPISRLPPPAETSTFAALSVADTVRCFRECRLTELADLCEKEGLDGCFIDKLTPDDLSKDPFNLTVLHRMKVEQIKHGWRPCYE